MFDNIFGTLHLKYFDVRQAEELIKRRFIVVKNRSGAVSPFCALLRAIVNIIMYFLW